MPASDATKAPYTTNPPPPSSSLPIAHNTSPAPPSSEPERDNASPPPVSQPDVPDEKILEPAEAHDMRRESLSSVGMPLGPSSQTVEFTAGQPHQVYRSNSVGYFANRLHAGNAFQLNRRSPDSYRCLPTSLMRRVRKCANTHRHEFLPVSRPSSAAPGPLLPPPQSSKFRLSMSVEGKAELVPQPSPPRLSPSALSDSSVPPDRPYLHRSYSAAGSITLPPISALTASLEADLPPPQTHVLQQPQPRFPPRLYLSRSRDVHAWELACEANSGEHRDELTTHAERESSGSAIAAISLLRTLSSSSHPHTLTYPHPSPTTHVLQSNTAKRNARPSAQHQQQHAKKPKLSRSSSSVARLQTDFVNTTTNRQPTRRNTPGVDTDESKFKMSMLLSPGGNDSDKENWSPDDGGHASFRGSQRAPTGRRPLPSAPLPKSVSSFAPQKSRRRVLEDGTNRFMLGRSSTAPAARRKKGRLPIEIFEDCGDDADASDNEEQRRPARDGVTDEEVERFMRGEVSPSKKGAASAIAGLLALSQGNWR